MPGKNHKRKPNTYWTDAEKLIVCDSAAAVQEVRPELAGVSLLNEAAKVLPKSRRRTFRSIGDNEQWFVDGLPEAIARRRAVTAALKAGDPPVDVHIVRDPDDPMIEKLADAETRTLTELHLAWHRYHQEAVTQMRELGEQIVGRLDTLIGLLSRGVGPGGTP